MISVLLMIKIAQLFSIMLIAYIITKLKVVKGDDSLVLSKISLYVLLPAAIINAFNTELTKEIKTGLLLAFAASVVIHILFYLMDFAYKKATKASPVERASIMYSNAANLIIPIVTYVLGGEWVIYCCAYMSVQLVFLWTHGIGLFRSDHKNSLKKILCNPCLISIGVGLVLMLSGIRLPERISDVTVSLGDMLGPTSMLIAGMLFAKSDAKSIFTNKRSYVILLMRMVVCPFIVLILFKVFLPLLSIVNAEKILLITFLSSMTPTAATVMQFAQIHDVDVELAVSSNIVTTLSCILIMPVLVFLYLL